MSGWSSIHEALDQFARASGLEKKSDHWYRHGDGVVAVTGVQKSQYGSQYYVNQGFWLSRLDATRYPRATNCHIILRLEGLAPNQRAEIAELFDLERDIPEESRINRIVDLLNRRLLPVISRGQSVAGLRDMMADGTLSSAAIRGGALQELRP